MDYIYYGSRPPNIKMAGLESGFGKRGMVVKTTVQNYVEQFLGALSILEAIENTMRFDISSRSQKVIVANDSSRSTVWVGWSLGWSSPEMKIEFHIWPDLYNYYL